MVCKRERRKRMEEEMILKINKWLEKTNKRELRERYSKQPVYEDIRKVAESHMWVENPNDIVVVKIDNNNKK